MVVLTIEFQTPGLRRTIFNYIFGIPLGINRSMFSRTIGVRNLISNPSSMTQNILLTMGHSPW